MERGSSDTTCTGAGLQRHHLHLSGAGEALFALDWVGLERQERIDVVRGKVQVTIRVIIVSSWTWHRVTVGL